MSRLTAVVIVFALALVALLVYDVSQEKNGKPGEDPAETAARAAPAPSSGVELSAAQKPIGTVVTSGGATLYRFDKDTPKPPKATCNGACAGTWPPLVSRDGAPRVNGVDAALVGTVTRDDGSAQVTLNGWPLYTFAKDGPGETKGEGVGGTWHAIAPTGKPAVAK